MRRTSSARRRLKDFEQVNTFKQRGRHLVTAALVGLLVGALGLVAAAPASAQGGLPAICDEYPNLPECQPLPQPPDDDPRPDADDDEGPSAGVGATGGGGSGDGKLPFTGYPVTGLVLLLLGLLTLGLMIRGAVALRERFARNPSVP